MLRPCYAEIDLAAIAHNLAEYKRVAPVASQFMAVVKADAYGHGAEAVLHKAIEAGVDWAGVALVEEAIELRKQGFTLPILLLGGIFPPALPFLVEYQITPVAYSLDCLNLLTHFAKEHKIRLKIHLKLDTGMGRLGLNLSQYQEFLKGYDPLQGVEIDGLMTHFACADEADKSYSLAQVESFNAFKKLGEGIINPTWVHLSNSAGTSELDPHGANLFRIGIGLYGQQPSDQLVSPLNLQAAMSFKASIMQLQWHPEGACLGYGATFTTTKRSLIATLCVGYADGLPRKLSNIGRVLVRGVSCPIVGRISMDTTLIDVTSVASVKLFDLVTLMGKDQNEEITAMEIAQLTGTINYEITCGISQRVPRIYKNE